MSNVSSHKTAQGLLEAMGTVSQVDSDLNSSRCVHYTCTAVLSTCPQIKKKLRTQLCFSDMSPDSGRGSRSTRLGA